MTGASGSVYGVRLLQILQSRPDVETHLIVSKAGVATADHELGMSLAELRGLADVVHPIADIGASIASGSFPVDGMVVAPCSIKTLSAIANCYAVDLISRAADVQLKEGHPLVLMVRETPLHLGHLRLMTQAAEAGAVIAPPVPAFYTRPSSVEQIVDYTVRRVLSRLGVEQPGIEPWPGLHTSRQPIDGVVADLPPLPETTADP